MKRRNFLKSSVVASSTMMMPAFLKSGFGQTKLTSRSGKILVVVQLSGGNDGLNTVVPYENDIYYKNRPTLAIPKKEVLKLDDGLGLHPSLGALRDLYNNGELSVINSVGYPNPNRSHFRSMDIWQTGSASDEFLSTGWLGRYLDSECETCPVYQAIEVDDGLSLAMKGAQRNAFAMSNVNKIRKAADNKYLKKMSQLAAPEEHNVAYLYKTLADTQQSTDYLYEKTKAYRSKITYPKSAIGKDFKQIAELITTDSPTQIYYVSLGGFDTHSGQKKKQHNLLKEYSQAIEAFTKDLKSNDLFEDVVIMTFSEFGRRVNQNASGGTDHGTANNVFLMGGKLKRAGFYNEAPDLTNLASQDLDYDIDFREIYATVLDKCLNANSNAILNGNFKGLNVL